MSRKIKSNGELISYSLSKVTVEEQVIRGLCISLTKLPHKGNDRTTMEHIFIRRQTIIHVLLPQQRSRKRNPGVLRKNQPHRRMIGFIPKKISLLQKLRVTVNSQPNLHINYSDMLLYI